MDSQKIVRDAIRSIPDFPKPGILFRDITPVMENPTYFAAALDGMEAMLKGVGFDKLVAIESRGFLFGAPLALRFQKPLVLLRKAGKLPGKTISVSYDLEYGQAILEIHAESIEAGDRVVVMDDLLATGGTAAAAGQLIEKCHGRVAAYSFLVELDGLGGSKELENISPVFSLVHY